MNLPVGSNTRASPVSWPFHAQPQSLACSASAFRPSSALFSAPLRLCVIPESGQGRGEGEGGERRQASVSQISSGIQSPPSAPSKQSPAEAESHAAVGDKRSYLQRPLPIMRHTQPMLEHMKSEQGTVENHQRGQNPEASLAPVPQHEERSQPTSHDKDETGEVRLLKCGRGRDG